MKLFRLLPLLIGLGLLGACSEKEANSNRDVALDDYRPWADVRYAVNSHVVRTLIDSLLRNDGSITVADHHTHRYYRNHGGFLWIDRYGVSASADTLLAYLDKVGEMGFSERRFAVSQISEDLQRMRTLRLGDGRLDANHVLARLEFRLTKSYLRYAAGQRFGYVNPTYVLNHVDSIEPNPYETIVRPVRYRDLFGVRMDHADDSFFRQAMSQVASEQKLGQFLASVQPRSAFYRQLQLRLQRPGMGRAERAKILCNMERCRWRQADSPDRHQKYVLVNIPSFHLYAIDHADTLSMRIGCGAIKTKTPLLNSYIKRMDINPKWFMPRSIIVKDVAHHAGNPSYFAARNYYVVNRATGEEVTPCHVSHSMLLSSAYGVVQRGGKGNALGRIIFRFDNNYAVYLHDTSSRGVFEREDRGVSHGCVRVEKPFELARFLLADKDEKLLDKINYSMTADSLSDRSRVVGSVKLQPQVPVFITYYTLYPMGRQGIATYPDVYGYDRVIFEQLQKYL